MTIPFTATPFTTTLNRIHACGPRSDGWRRKLAALGKTAADDEPLLFAELMDLLQFDDVLLCCRSAPEYDAYWLRFAEWCTREVVGGLTIPRSLLVLDEAAGAAAEASVWASAWAAKAAAEESWADGASWADAEASWAAARQRQAVAFRQLVTDGTLPPAGREVGA